MSAQRPTALQHFNGLAAHYEASTGGCTRDVARLALEFSPEFTGSSSVLDNACGNGIVAQEILLTANAASQTPPAIHCVDGAPAMVDLARATIQPLPNAALTKFDTMSGEALSLPSDTFTHSITNIALLFFVDGLQGAKEIYRTLKPGGTAVVTSWKDLGYIRLVQQAQKAVRPNDPAMKPPVGEEWYREEHLVDVLRESDFADVRVDTKEVHYGATTVTALCELLLVTFSGLTREWSDEEKTRFKSELEKAVAPAAQAFQRPVWNGQEKKLQEFVGIPITALIAVAKK
ncbi:S-adenosyl-L-methionine-dependent methyltransferase [Massariosphaeria phaeospora]|uniref:S-adenosyl-L-methionine-dependent methyltransferase n=1 Tax=Massariosphaeria phaeospora TaxID=100035 RepID=A0A7C8I2J3_9PLEO|nr:S-adenosyl-L-methionine-dependent methyltransferase [Massariosphaeria phaeospora]